MRPGSVSGPPRPSSVYDAGSPMRAGLRTAVNLAASAEQGEYLPQQQLRPRHTQTSPPPPPGRPAPASSSTRPRITTPDLWTGRHT